MRESDSIKERGQVELEDCTVCAYWEDELLCTDPVNEWVITLMVKLDPVNGSEFAGTRALHELYRATMFPDGGLEVPWANLPESQRHTICEQLLQEDINQPEKFGRLTEYIQGVLWPGFRSEREVYSWAQLDGMR